MYRTLRLALACSIFPMIVLSAAACSSTATPTTPASTTAEPTTPPLTTSPTTTNDETAAIRAYANPITQTAMEGLSEGDLEKYTRFAGEQFKIALTQNAFDQTSALVKSQLGDFVSITFLSTEKQEGFTIVHYRAKYAKGETGVRMVFDRDHLIAGQWFEQ